MNDHIFQTLVPLIGLVSGFIGAYVGLQNRALLAEVRKENAELENRIIARINGTYVRVGECSLREELVAERIRALAAGVHKAEPPPDR
jgi:hypothetical protein